MQNLHDALNTYQYAEATMPNGLGHVEVTALGEHMYHWASFYGNSIKPSDDDWCDHWLDLLDDLARFDLDADAAIWMNK